MHPFLKDLGVKIFKNNCAIIPKVYLYIMNRKTKKSVFIIGGILLVLVIGFFILDYIAQQKFKTAVEKLPSHIELQYEDVDISIFGGNFKLSKPLLNIKGKITGETNAQIEMDFAYLKDFSYWSYLVNDTISIENIIFENPQIIYYHNDVVKDSSYNSSLQGQIKKSFKIRKIQVNNAKAEVFNIENDSLIFKTDAFYLDLDAIELNSETLASRLPFNFGNVSVRSKNLKYQVGEFEHLFIDSLHLKNQRSMFSEVKFKTKYGKRELSQIIKKERDHFNVEIASVEILGQDMGFHGDSIFDFSSKNIVFEQPKLEVYRDKLVADDTTRKDLYSKMLRILNIDLTIDEVNIKNGTIVYEEKVKAENKAGQLKFNQLDANITKLSNTYPEGEKTKIDISAIFMENTPLKVDWQFDVNNVNDQFTFAADLGLLKADHLNPFMQPNLNIKLEGELLKTYFTIDANANKGSIDLKTDYDQFDIVILKSNGREKNKFLSNIVNLFVAKSSDKKENDFRYGSSTEVDRDKTKSVFNYVWLNVKSGLQSAMIGSGKKKE